MTNFDETTLGSLEIAQAEAIDRQNVEIFPEHLLWGLLHNPKTWSYKGLAKIKKTVDEALKKLPTTPNQLSMDQLRPNARFSEWLTLASAYGVKQGDSKISEKTLLRFLPKVLPELDIDIKGLGANLEDMGEDESAPPAFLVNLNDLAKDGKLDPVIGRSKEIRAVMEILGRRGKNNPVLVGPAGVGKTAIVEGLAGEIYRNRVPDVLKDKIVYALNMGQLMAGTKYRGEFEERLEQLLKFFKQNAGEAILFIDEIHLLVGAGKTDGAMDAANLLKPALARGELKCIGATTPAEYQKHILGDSALDRRFRSVPVNAPTKEDSIEILMGLREKFEIHHGIKISDEAIYQAVILSDKYITDKNLPDKAIDLIDEAASAFKIAAEAMPAKLVEQASEIRSKKINATISPSKELQAEIEELETIFARDKAEWEKEILHMKVLTSLKNDLEQQRYELEEAELKLDYEKASQIKFSTIPKLEQQLAEVEGDWVLNPKDIANVVSRQKQIPVEKILKSKQEHFLELEKRLNARVLGQSEALTEIADTLIASHAGLKDASKPLGSFLLRGPSGVGKTETAKALAAFLFDSEEHIIRLDMSEYSEAHSVAKLIGAPAGYVGHDEGGVLTEAVRQMPYSIVLLDEVEKAHRNFSDILLQVLDDGRLTDNKGRVIDFKNTIVILTTNSTDLERDFKPEVLGRIDAILTYNPLEANSMEAIVGKLVTELNDKLKGKQLEVELDPAMVEQLTASVLNTPYGARPLRSLFEKQVVRPLSKQLIKGQLPNGTVHVKFKDGEVSFQ